MFFLKFFAGCQVIGKAETAFALNQIILCNQPNLIVVEQFKFCIFGAIKESSKDAELELLNDYQIGLITKDDLIESIGSLSFSNYKRL